MLATRATKQAKAGLVLGLTMACAVMYKRIIKKCGVMNLMVIRSTQPNGLYQRVALTLRRVWKDAFGQTWCVSTTANSIF